jgi:cytochrome c biogenesis protein ResB
VKMIDFDEHMNEYKSISSVELIFFIMVFFVLRFKSVYKKINFILFYFFLKINIFFCFHIILIKTIYIILMHFQTKNTLKNNSYFTFKHTIKSRGHQHQRN